VQINGKVRDKIEADAELSKEEYEKTALESSRIQEMLKDKQIVKVITVPAKLVNIVVK